MGAALASVIGLSAADAAAGFTPLLALPAPKIVDRSPPYPGGAYNAENLIDGELRSEYSSNGAGTNTFVEFDFGAPTVIAGFRHVDRNDPATIGGSQLEFRDGAGSRVAVHSVTHLNARGGVTFIALPAPVMAQRVRWQVTALSPPQHGTVGGAELAFYTAGATTPSPNRTTLEAIAVPVAERRAGRPFQPLQVLVQFPYAATVDAQLRVPGLDPKPVRLELGSQTVTLSLATVDAPRTVPVSLEASGLTIARAEVQQAPVRALTIYLLPHSHVDIGYTELQTEVEQKQMRNLARALELIQATADYPEGARYKWNSEVLWAVDSFLRQQPAPKQAALLDAVKRGQIGLDGMYGNLLTGLCRPEELLRAFRFGTELGQRCGVPVECAMISDVPGYTWGTVQTMASAGVKYFSIAPNYFDRIGTTLVEWENKPFYWVAATGREQVLCWVPYYGYALSHVIGELSESFLRRMATHFATNGYPYDIAYLRWSGHGDNAVPDERLPESVKDWNARYAWPKLVIATTGEAFRAFEQRHGAQLPRVRGDWTPYWEDGAASSARETALNRASADRLVQAETLWALRQPAPFPATDFHAAWRNVLLYSEHTWGAHNSISEPDKPFVRDQWKIKQAFALDADRQSQELLARAIGDPTSRPTATLPASPAIDVWNTASWARTELVRLTPTQSAAGDRVEDDRGRAVASQRLSSGELAFRAEAVPPFAARRYRVVSGAAASTGRARAHGLRLQNGKLAVGVDGTTGAITELRTAGSGSNLADPSGGALNDYLYLPGSDAKAARRNGPVRVSVKESGPLVAALSIESEAPGCRRLAREIRLCDGADAVEIANTIDKLPVREKEGVHFGFAFQVADGELRMDIPWAVMQPEKDQIPGSCKNWLTAGRWVDVSNRELGVTWITLDAPLVEVGDLTATLIGSQTNPKVWQTRIAPSQRIYSWVMNNHWHTNYRAEQDGPTTFRYALRPHRRFAADAATRAAVALSQPLMVVPASGVRPSPPRLQVSPAGIVATVLKPSDDGQAWILRLFGASGKAEQARIRWAKPVPPGVWISDTSEQRRQRAPGVIDVPPYGIVTLRAEP